MIVISKRSSDYLRMLLYLLPDVRDPKLAQLVSFKLGLKSALSILLRILVFRPGSLLFSTFFSCFRNLMSIHVKSYILENNMDDQLLLTNPELSSNFRNSSILFSGTNFRVFINQLTLLLLNI